MLAILLAKQQKRVIDNRQPFVYYGAPGEIRTPDRLVRSQVLYPAELRAHLLNGWGLYIKLAEREDYSAYGLALRAAGIAGVLRRYAACRTTDLIIEGSNPAVMSSFFGGEGGIRTLDGD
jgi:hypothetical protein